MKPRIRKEMSILYRCQMWFCRGAGCLGVASDPALAYWDWMWRVNEKARQRESEDAMSLPPHAQYCKTCNAPQGPLINALWAMRCD